MSRKNKSVIGFVFGALVIGAVGFLSGGFMNWKTDDWRDKIIPPVSVSEEPVSEDAVSEDPSIEEPTSEDPISEEPSSEEIPPSSEEPINPFDSMVENSQGEYIFQTQENIAPLVQTTYKSSATSANLMLGPSLDKEFTFNSLKHFKNVLDAETGTYELNLQFGFPTTITDAHTTNIFGLPGTYTSYLLPEYKVLNSEGINLLPANLGVSAEDAPKLMYVYRSATSLTWKSLGVGNTLTIAADNDYYQIGIAFNTNNKSDNVRLSRVTL